jgi:hypothetical protein
VRETPYNFTDSSFYVAVVGKCQFLLILAVRLLLEVTWEALEDAGLPADHLKGSNTGVYTGVTSSGAFIEYHPYFKSRSGVVPYRVHY